MTMENAVRNIEKEIIENDPVLDISEENNAEKLYQTLTPATRQYIPSNSMQLANNTDSSNESMFRSLFGNFLFNRQPGLTRSHATVDLLLTIFCFVTVHLTYLGSLDFSTQRTIALYSSVVFIILALAAGGSYGAKRLRSLNSEIFKLVLCWMCAFAAVGLFAFLTKTAAEVSRVWITTSMVFTLAVLAGARVMSCLGFMTATNVRAKNIVVCGNAPRIKSVMHNLYALSNSRFKVARVFEFSTLASAKSHPTSLEESPAEQIIKFVEKQRQSGNAIEQVWIAVSQDQSQMVEELSETLVDSTVDVCVVPDNYTERLLDGEITKLGDSKIVNISEVSLSPAADQFKRVFDFVLAAIGVVILALPMAIIAALIKLESPGPALFRQKRYGVDGQEIEVLKFRSMLVHSDQQVKQATRNDSRVTRTGKFLRSSSLDELPQLLNVLSGTMSLIGPRPHATAHNEIWRNKINGYMLRHKVKPGITGWAQVKGWRGETETVYKMQQRVKYDLEYIKTWSPWLDVKILFLTVISLGRDENAY